MSPSRPTALVMCGADPASDPRPQRMIRCLARDFDVHVISRGGFDLPGVTCERIPAAPRKSFPRKLLGVARMRFLRDYRHVLWPAGLRPLASRNRRAGYDFIAVHDLLLLPVALAIRSRRGRLLFDAREYYARHYEDRLWWRLMFQPLNRDLCRRYLPRADVVTTVSNGLAAEYAREFGVTCEVMPGLPAYQDLSPSPVDPDRVRLIHHGLASRSRHLEGMIEMMDHLPPHISLDLMLVPSDPAYTRELEARCTARQNVRLIPPVPFAQIVPFSNAYDVGVFLVPPVSFNLRFALPNKFFEFIQARLAVAIGPSPDMAGYVREHDLGVVADDFAPATLAAALRRLTPAEIQRLKQNAHRAAALLHSGRTEARIRELARAPTAAASPS